MSKKNPTLKKIVDLDPTMHEVLEQTAKERNIASKRLLESFIITGLLKNENITLKQAEDLRDRQARLMEKKQWLYR